MSANKTCSRRKIKLNKDYIKLKEVKAHLNEMQVIGWFQMIS